jgi:hypothetical protein
LEVTKVYSSSFSYTLAAGVGGGSVFQISSANRELQLKSILLDWKSRNNTTNAIVPFELNGLQKFALQIGDANRQIALPFEYLSGTLLVSNGIFIQIYSPGQYFFDSFFIKNSIGFNLSIQNDEAATAFTHLFHLTVETSEKIIY